MAKSVLRLTVEEHINTELLRNKINLIEPFYLYVTYNLLDIGELIRRDTKIYDAPNIECIKKSREFKEIIERFKNLNNLFGNGDALNDNEKSKKLLSVVAAYLTEKGISIKVQE